jgi:hypothetical protein
MPFAEFSPAEVGTNAGGFRIVGTAQGLLRLTVWGYWSPDVVRSFGVDGPAALQRLMPTSALVVDANELKPQGADGQEALRVLFRALTGVALAKATVISVNALTRMQLARLLRECGVDGRVDLSDNSAVTPGT